MEKSQKINGVKIVKIENKNDLDNLKKQQWAKSRWDFSSEGVVHSFRYAILPKEDLSFCIANDVIFDNSQMPKIIFWKAMLIRAFFKFTDIQEANFYEANCAGVNFTGSVLLKCLFFGAYLKGANFCGTDCSESNFQNADLRKLIYNLSTTFKGALYNSKTLFDDDFNPEAKGMINTDNLPKMVI